MSTHNICFQGGIRKMSCGYPLLPGSMYIFGQTGLSKLCSSRSEATEHVIKSGSTLFPTHSAVIISTV